MRKFFLWLVMLPAPLWRALGADTDQLRAILDTRLILDDRSPTGIARMRGGARSFAKTNKPNKRNYSVLSIVLSVIMGGIYMFPLFAIPDRIFSMMFFFLLIIMNMTLMLITDFSNILFDTRDKYILFPRPINSATLMLSRILHIFIYLTRIVAPMTIPAWVLVSIQDGWKSAVLFPITVVLMLSMVLFFVNGIYLLVLNLTKPEKFKDVISYFQVAASIAFFASVYMVPRVFDPEHPLVFDPVKFSWVIYFPGYWLAACWSWLGFSAAIPGSSAAAVAAFLVPLVCIYLLLRFLAPQFVQRISAIDGVDASVPSPGGKKASKGKLYQTLNRIVNSSEDARAGFALTWLQTSRNRTFRMRVYPIFAYVPVYFIYLLSANHDRTMAEQFHRLSARHGDLLLLYMTAFVMVTSLTYLTISDQYKAAWVFYASPVQKPGKIMIGAFKAILVKFFLPFFIIISIFILYVNGPSAIWDILLVLANILVFAMCMARISYRRLPFSMMEQAKQGGMRVMKSFGVMIIPTLLGAAHFLVAGMLVVKIIFLALAIIFLWLVWDSYANTSWSDIAEGEADIV